MRIVGGKYKGRVLEEFKGSDIRPTSDKARESLYNILQFRIAGASFLDLFCGTGAMGIEALSRGASKVTFNDIDRKSIALLKSNLQKLKVDEQYSVFNYDAFRLLKTTCEKFDIIYIDPPYALNLGASAVEQSINALAPHGLIILEDEKAFDGEIEGLIKTDCRKYGRIHLTFFQKGER